MRIILLIPCIYLAAVADTSLADALRIGAIAPDILALTAAVWLVAFRSPYAFLGAGLAGLAADLLAPGRIGIGAAGWLLIGYALTRLRWRLAFTHLLGQVPLVAAAISIWAAAVGLLHWLLGEVAIGPATIVVRAIETGLYTAVVAVPPLLVIGWVGERPAETGDFAEY